MRASMFEGDNKAKLSPVLDQTNSLLFKYGGRLYFWCLVAFLPLVFIGFTCGYLQSLTLDKHKKKCGYVLGGVNLVLIWCLYQYIT